MYNYLLRSMRYPSTPIISSSPEFLFGMNFVLINSGARTTDLLTGQDQNKVKNHKLKINIDNYFKYRTEQMIGSHPGHCFFSLQPGIPVAAVVNLKLQ